MLLALFLLECLGLVAACAVALLLCRKGPSPSLRGVRRAFGRLARRKRLAVLLVALSAVGGAAALTPLVCPPLPNVHDEFAYLLASDTFAHGKLANPPHPMWVHFETFHVIHSPTYAAKYPPGQGLILALGQALTGHPVVGVWLSMGLCCGAICWMLQGWLPPRWALAGALLFTGKLVFCGEYAGTVGYWGQSYWGGAMAAFGGALVFGALRRLARRPAVGTSIVLGVGLVVLANSRPFEGMVVCLPVAGMLLAWLVRARAGAWALARRVCLPIALVLAAGAGCMAYYNVRVTGHPLRMPYIYHESIYAVAPAFIWQPLRPEPTYNHPVVRDLWARWACDDYHAQYSSPRMFLLYLSTKVERLFFFFLGVSLTVPLLALPWTRSDRWFLFALGTCGLLTGVLMLHIAVQPHYAAPMTALIVYLVTALLRRLSRWRWGDVFVGRALTVGVIANCAFVMVMSVAIARQRVVPDAWWRERDRVARQLAATPGRHLVIVRYGPDHVVDEEWVYNEADIDGARVIWARSMNPDADRRLIEYFAGRRVWLLDADTIPPQPEPQTSEPPGIHATSRKPPG